MLCSDEPIPVIHFKVCSYPFRRIRTWIAVTRAYSWAQRWLQILAFHLNKLHSSASHSVYDGGTRRIDARSCRQNSRETFQRKSQNQILSFKMNFSKRTPIEFKSSSSTSALPPSSSSLSLLLASSSSSSSSSPSLSLLLTSSLSSSSSVETMPWWCLSLFRMVLNADIRLTWTNIWICRDRQHKIIYFKKLEQKTLFRRIGFLLLDIDFWVLPN